MFLVLQYETQEQAEKTRQTLHGTRWPESNPKSLRVDYGTEEQLEFHRSGDTMLQKQPSQPSKVQCTGKQCQICELLS